MSQTGWMPVDETAAASGWTPVPETEQKVSEAQMVANRPGKVAPIPGIPRSPMEMVGGGVGDEAQGNAQIASQYVQAGPMEVGRGVRDIGRGNIARGGHRAITGAGVTAIPAAISTLPIEAISAPLATALGAAGAIGGQQVASRGAAYLGANPDQAALAGDIGGMAGTLAAKVPSLVRSRLASLVRSLTSTTPERLAELGQVESKFADIHALVSKTEELAHDQASAAFPDIKSPVQVAPKHPGAIPGMPLPEGQFVTEADIAPREIDFRAAQKQFSELSKDARAAHLARMQGRATGFVEEAILKQKNALGDAMQAAAEKDGKLRQFLTAKAKFQEYMNDFHNRGSAVEPLLQMKPDETARIASHMLHPDKGARAIEVLEKYGANTGIIDDMLKMGSTSLKVAVNEASKLRKLGDLYPELRLNESIDQAKFNRLPSSAQAKLPAWAMRSRANLPLLPDALTPDIPTRAIIRRLLESNLARAAVKK